MSYSPLALIFVTLNKVASAPEVPWESVEITASRFASRACRSRRLNQPKLVTIDSPKHLSRSSDGKRMRTGVEQTRSQKEKAQREESKAESPPTDAHLPKPKVERRPVLALALVSFAGCALLASAAVLVAWACTEGNDDYEGRHWDDY